jgi:hypothetical protein
LRSILTESNAAGRVNPASRVPVELYPKICDIRRKVVTTVTVSNDFLN